MKTRYRIAAALIFSNLISASHAEDIVEEIPAAAVRARIAIIIDDVGYKLSPGRDLAESPHDLTIAIIPFTPHGNTIAKLAHKNEKEVMLHAPMEPMGGRRWENGLTVSMSESELHAALEKMLRNIPHVVGVNNHGGSKLTQDRARMGWLMDSLAAKRLYFVDSRTIATSAASTAAEAVSLPHASRDVFLDNNKDPEQIRAQLHKLRNIATRTGRAIGIGHPYSETIAIVVEELPKFYRSGIQLVSASKLLKTDETEMARQNNVNSDRIFLAFDAKID